jgi:hypothetical protein
VEVFVWIGFQSSQRKSGCAKMVFVFFRVNVNVNCNIGHDTRRLKVPARLSRSCYFISMERRLIVNSDRRWRRHCQMSVGSVQPRWMRWRLRSAVRSYTKLNWGLYFITSLIFWASKLSLSCNLNPSLNLLPLQHRSQFVHGVSIAIQCNNISSVCYQSIENRLHSIYGRN